jgi:tRNA (uracil-5-)-methyltransferase TRM9
MDGKKKALCSVVPSNVMEGGMSNDLEAEHVHKVYNCIAKDFSRTRYKPWPVIEKFLLGLDKNTVCLDNGCGNGKYLSVNKNITMIGSDYSTNLVKLARELNKNTETLCADSLSLHFRNDFFDNTICIAFRLKESL